MSLTWADYRYLASSEFFKITKDIYDLEEEFHKHVQSNYMRDSMHNTRRFEYPWVVLNMPPTGGRVLDVGSGGSSLTAYLSSRNGEYYALDHDMNAINQIDTIRDILELWKLRPVYCDAQDMSVLHTDSFDVTISVSVIEHMSKEGFKRAVDEIVRVTKSTGVMMLTMDVSVTRDSARTDLEDLRWLTDKFKIEIPNIVNTTMVNMIQGSNVPFYVACILLRNFK